MRGGGLTFNNAGWLLPVLLLVGLAVLASLRDHRRQADAASRLALGLRLAGFLVLGLALLEPAWSSPRPRPGANFFALVADNSRSLRLGAGGQSRGDGVRAALQADAPWLRSLGETYQLRRYLFDDRLERVPDFSARSGLRFDGPASHLASALRSLADRFRGAPLGGVLLWTDGIATDVEQRLAEGGDLRGLPPLYPVVPETPVPLPDLALTQVSASETLFEDAPVSVEARVESAGFRARPVAVELRDERDRVVETQRFTPQSDAHSASVRFRVRPPPTPRTPAGQARAPLAGAGAALPYRVVVRSEVASGTPPGEATAANNTRHVLVPRPRSPSRVLYVGGRPSWEYKFLNRAVEHDPALELVGLVRLARREPKFAFLTRKGEATNPLYRGFGANPDDAERFDEPVLQRLGTRDAQELAGGFPASAESLFDFQALVLDDLEAGFFTAAQQALVERFVAERGGALLMLGGIDSFRQGGYQRTPIGDLLPVYLDQTPAGPLTPARWNLSREGWLEAWARLRDGEAAERARLTAMPAFEVVSGTRGLKPGATVLATLEAGKTSVPALVVQRAGDGRSAALTVGDLWRWSTRRSPGDPDDLGRFWRQTLRALVSDVPPAVSVALEPRPGEAGALTVSVRVRGRDFRPADGARLELEAFAPDGGALRLSAEPSPSEPGLYQAAYRPRGSGVHRVEARARGADGQPIGEAGAGRAVDLEADEHRSVRPNLALLEDLARRTGGALVRPDELDDLVRRLRDRPAPVSDLVTRPLWHSWAVLLVALGCFVGAWALRRRRGLP